MDYKSARWRNLRDQVQRRDKYLCRENARYGRMVEGTVVHHIWPAEDYPEYAWCEWNLVLLSATAHNAMHDRETNKLTELGEAWRRRTPPPPSRGYFSTPWGPVGGTLSNRASSGEFFPGG